MWGKLEWGKAPRKHRVCIREKHGTRGRACERERQRGGQRENREEHWQRILEGVYRLRAVLLSEREAGVDPSLVRRNIFGSDVLGK